MPKITKKQPVKKIQKNDVNTKLREFLMTSFLVVAVYELISKPLFVFLYDLGTQQRPFIQNNHIDIIGFIFNIYRITFEIIGNILPHWFFSSFPGANSNFIITVFSIAFTGFLIGLFFRFSNFLFEHPKIRKYMNGSGRKLFYTDELGARLLLTFMIFGVLILFLYPVFGVIVLYITLARLNQKDN